MLVASCAQARPLILVVGDSTAYSLLDATLAVARPDLATTLEALLRKVPRDHAYWRSRVKNYGVPGTTTAEWIHAEPRQAVCDWWGAKQPFVLVACARHIPLLQAVDERPTLILVQLGLNDNVFNIPPSETVAYLREMMDAWPGVPVKVAAPVIPEPWHFYADDSQAIRDEMKRVGGFAPWFPMLPTGDGLHLTTGGYAAAAALWLDELSAE